MIKLKKRNFKEEKLKLLASIGNNDMKHKWKIIKSITDADSNKEDPAKEIDLRRWKDYFQNLYNSNVTNDNLPKSFNYKGNQNRIDRADFEKMEKFLNCPFTKKEILACKKNSRVLKHQLLT